MKKTIFILTSFFLLSFQVKAQDSLKAMQERFYQYLMDSTENRISWGCGYAGIPTDNIFLIRSLIYHKRFDLISQLLDSRTASTRYLASLALIRSSKKHKLHLDSSTLNKIEKVKQDDELIRFCSGCTRHWSHSIRSLFNKKWKMRQDNWTRNWIDQSFKKE